MFDNSSPPQPVLLAARAPLPRCGFTSTRRRPRKSSKCSTQLTSDGGGESVRTVARRVLIQICLVTAYDSCAGPPPPHQQACVKRKSSLDNQQLCSSACINLSYHRGDSGFFFQRVFDTGTVAFPSEVSHWLVAFIGTQDLRRGILSEGSAFCLGAKKNTCILSEFVEKGGRILAPLRGTGKVLWEASIPFGPLDVSPSARRRSADAGGATCSAHSKLLRPRSLYLSRRSPLLNKCWEGKKKKNERRMPLNCVL